ncbi:MAG: P-loop NTPase [Phycisphaerales bacterium]
MPLTKQDLVAALSAVPHPATGTDLAASGCVLKTSACDGFLAVTLDLAAVPAAQHGQVLRAAEVAIRQYAAARNEPIAALAVNAAPGGGAPARGGHGAPAQGEPKTVSLTQQAQPAAAPKPSGPMQEQAPVLPWAKHVVAVGAGKGGVGKSTIAVNVAVGLARKGHAVGLLDGDIYGPSLPTMLGLHSLETNIRGNMLQPFMVHGIKAMTIGKLVDPEKALIWRGPMAHGAFKQLVEQTEWGELDYLIIDLPPGTGDVSLTLAQTLKLTGAVVVCTPQRVAQDDAVRAVRMFQQLGIDVLGVVENMSYFIGDDGKEYDIFGRGGAQTMAQRLGVPFLGSVPINMALRKNSDSGDPSANFDAAVAGETLVRDLDSMIQTLEGQVALASYRMEQGTPTLTIS